MTFNRDYGMKVLLLAGIEDYCALYQALGEIHGVAPDLPEQDRYAVTKELLQTLLNHGWITFVWVAGIRDSLIAPIDPPTAQELMMHPEHWVIMESWDDSRVCFYTTDLGEQFFPTLVVDNWPACLFYR